MNFYNYIESGQLPTRDKIDSEYKWNLSDIYPTEDLLKKDFDWIEDTIASYIKYEGSLGESAEHLLKFIKMDEEVRIKFGRVIRYSLLAKDLDLNNEKYQALYERASMLSTKLETVSAFVEPELLEIPENTLFSFIEEIDELKIYKHRFENLFRMKSHILSKEIEEVLALSGPLQRVPYETYSLFAHADIKFPKVKDDKGNEIEISHGRYYSALESTDRAYRKRVYKRFYFPFTSVKNTLCTLFTGNLKSADFRAKVRKFNSNREAALMPNNIPESVYDNLINEVNNNLKPLQRWAALKKKILGLDELHPYDTYVTLFPSEMKNYSYEEGKEILLKGLHPLGNDYLSSLQKAFNNRWIDVYETKGKRSGAYSSGVTYGFHPYVLLNWNNKLGDVFTFAHEMGHNLHSYYTEQNQPFVYANYSIFIAEVASTLNEALLLDYLMENSGSKVAKLALIERYINNITTTFYRQTRFAEFEHIVHEKNKNSEPLTPEILSEIFGRLYQKYWGDEMVVDVEEKMSWARVPHFYYNFYVYQYATSFAASEQLSIKLKNEGESAVNKYLQFLKSGSSMYPIDLLKNTGVDLNSPDPVIAVAEKMDYLLDTLEELLAEK
ncbi:oligoendopeptidase F [Bacteroidota bacterium]